MPKGGITRTAKNPFSGIVGPTNPRLGNKPMAPPTGTPTESAAPDKGKTPGPATITAGTKVKPGQSMGFGSALVSGLDAFSIAKAGGKMPNNLKKLAFGPAARENLKGDVTPGKTILATALTRKQRKRYNGK